MRSLLKNALDLIGAGLVLAAGLTALYYWDPSRAFFKRLLTTNEYLYEAVEPQFQNLDQAAYLKVHDAATASQVRAKVIEVIWGEGGLPRGLPDEVVRDIDKRAEVPRRCIENPTGETMLRLECEVADYKEWENLAGVDELRFDFGPEYRVSAGYFRPHRTNGVLVIYHHGFAGTYHAQRKYLERLVAAGFAVAANNMDRYGDNVCGTKDALRWCAPSAGKFEVPFPLQIYFTPLAETINFAVREGGIGHVAMVGFSGGAWIASVMAAVDTRIEKSYPVAGVMPFHLRRDKEWPPNQVYPPLMEAAGMLDLFVMAAVGPGRRQMQFFNRFDRCCYNGPRPTLYNEAVRKAVQDAGGGSFEIVFDETHARHKVSRWAFDRILADLQGPAGR